MAQGVLKTRIRSGAVNVTYSRNKYTELAVVIDFFFYKFGITPAVCSGIGLWALGLYLSFHTPVDRTVDIISHWLNNTDRSLYSVEVLNRRPAGWEERNQLFASVLSILPVLAGAIGVFILMSGALGQGWAISTGLLVAVGAGVYQLGRLDARNTKTGRRR